MIIPSNSRYIPLTQQPACCVPTCIQMVMLKHKIPLIPAEELGYHLGLVVHPDRAGLFYNVRTSVTKPPSGYGTQTYLPEFDANKAFEKLHIPLKMNKRLISQFSSADALSKYLKEGEEKDLDVLFCFHHGVLFDEDKHWGHVVVFDRFEGDDIRIIDPSPDAPKWRIVSVARMFSAMQKHGDSNSAGVWELYVSTF